MPITWKNVGSSGGGGSPAAGVALFRNASDSIDQAFNKFNGLIDNAEATDQANWDQTKVNNTSAFKDLLAQARTPEELAALQASGALNTDQYGAQIDRDVVRDGADNRLQALQEAFSRDQAYTDNKEDVAARPLQDQYQAAYAKGDTAEMARLVGEENLGRTFEKNAPSQILDLTDKNRNFALNEQRTQSQLASDSLGRKLTQTKLDDINQAKTLDRLVGDFNAGNAAAEEQQSLAISQLAGKHGFTTDPKTGQIDYESGGNVEALNHELAARGLNADRGSKDREAFIASIRKEYGNAAADQALAATSGDATPYANLTSEQKAVLATEVGQIQLGVDAAEKQIAERLRVNPLAKVITDYTGTAKDLYASVKSTSKNDAELVEINEAVDAAIAADIPLALIDVGLKKIASGGEGWITDTKGASLTKYLGDMLSDSNYATQIKDAQEVQAAQANLNQLKIRQPAMENQAQKQTLSRMGVRVDSSTGAVNKLTELGNKVKEDKNKEPRKTLNGRWVN